GRSTTARRIRSSTTAPRSWASTCSAPSASGRMQHPPRVGDAPAEIRIAQALAVDEIDPAAEDRGAFVAGVEQRQLPRLRLVAESADAVVRDGDLGVVHLLGPPRPAGRAGPSPARGSPFTRHAAPLPSP